jgi:hypothetical protein
MGVVIDFVLDGVGVHRDFDDHVEFFGTFQAGCNVI